MASMWGVEVVKLDCREVKGFGQVFLRGDGGLGGADGMRATELRMEAS